VANESQVGTATPLHPRAGYIFGKLCGETIVNAYRQDDVDAKSVRLGLTYGPGTRKNDQRAMSTFIQQTLTTGKLELKYPGLEKRVFCYISDAVELMLLVLLHGKYAVYNIGGQTITSMRQIAAQIADLTGARLNYPIIEKEMDGARAVNMNHYRIQNEFGKKDFIGLEEGLKKTVDWQRGFYESI
jgi:nucleoside-diphosphate-sugar epimerase